MLTIITRYNKEVINFVKDSPFTARLLATLCASSAVSVLLLVIRMIVAGNAKFSFMIWNLLLAWLPVVFALGFRINMAKHRLQSWQNLALLGLWLGFLPNSFYLMSDLIHLQSSGEAAVLYDVAMMMSFIINGLILGYISVYLVHVQLLKKLSSKMMLVFLSAVFLACGFAIYLGRYLRWNTWDIVLNPFGILFDLSERVVNPVLHIQTYVTTLTFFVLLSSTYAVIYQLVRVLSTNVQKQ
jgi:uncharacterized membrane protein